MIQVIAAEPGIINNATTFGGTAGTPTDGGAILGLLMGRLFQTAVMVGGLALLLYLVRGGLNWITAGGDKGKLEEAKSSITNGIIGMAALVGTVAIAIFLGQVLGVDILNPTIQ